MGKGYSSYRQMVSQPEYGEWVRAEDYRKAVEGLRQEIGGLRHNWQTAVEAGLTLIEQQEFIASQKAR